MEQGRVSKENVYASSQFEEEQMLRGELNTLYLVRGLVQGPKRKR
jgi:hypothetical protein